jgi:hypothetical protein
MSGQSQRWQCQRSAYSWEQLALEHVKARLPDAEPYRAWQTFTFTTNKGTSSRSSSSPMRHAILGKAQSMSGVTACVLVATPIAESRARQRKSR